jgi:hypothetical protein
MKKVTVLLVICLFVVGMLAGCGGGDKKPAEKPAEKKVFINIATGGTAGVYYPLGGALSEILNKNIPGMNASAQSTGASIANINLIKDGKVELALVQNDTAYYAANGTEMFKDKKVAELQGIATLYGEAIQVVAKADKNIKSISDLKGLRVGVGTIGSGTEANVRQILEVYGMTYKDIKPQYLSFAEAANGLKDGNVDVAFVTAGAPTAAVQDIAAQHKIILVPIPADKADALIKKYPFFAKITVKANTYPGLAGDVPTVSVKAMLVTSSKVEADLFYKMTKAMYTNLSRIAAAHAQGVNVKKETALEGMPIAVHAGADKYFKEK